MWMGRTGIQGVAQGLCVVRSKSTCPLSSGRYGDTHTHQFKIYNIPRSKQTYKVWFSVCLFLLFPSLPLSPSSPIPLFSFFSSSLLPSHPQVKARDQNAQVSGYLMVHTSKTRRWKRKWFVVYNLVLYEFERHEVQ